MIITIDGPAGTGKSTVAKQVAQALDYLHIDTGAMYRCITWYLLQNKIPIDDEIAVGDSLEGFSLEIKSSADVKHYYVCDQDVTFEIRMRLVTGVVSQVATLQKVRGFLVKLQRLQAEGRDIVCEGRDIGTVVFPKADVKIYLTATADERAKRRFLEESEKNPKESLDLSKIKEDIIERDRRDMTRTHSPLKKADDAVEIDTTSLNKDEVVEEILKLTR